MTKSSSSIANIAKVDPRVTMFAIGAVCIVILGGMLLGYDVNLSVLGNEIRLSKANAHVPLLE